MNARMFLCALALALLLGGTGLWLREISSRHEHEKPPEMGAEIRSSSAGGPLGAQVEAAENSSRAPAGTAQPLHAEAAVVPMLELNAIADAAAGETTVERSRSALDALLGARYAGHSRAQRETSLRLIRAALLAQSPSDRAADKPPLSAESARALQLEADWLKEHLDP